MGARSIHGKVLLSPLERAHGRVGSMGGRRPCRTSDFLSSRSATAVLLKVANNTVTPVWSGDESMSNHYSTSVLKDGYLYGFDGRQEFGQTLRCVELATGKVMWNVDGFGAGSLLIAGDTLVITRE